MKPRWNIKAGMIYFGDKIWNANPQSLFQKYGTPYPVIRRMEDLTKIFNDNLWYPDASDLPPDA